MRERMKAASCVLKVEGLVKKFGNLEAVKSVRLCVNEGEIFGLLGPNGAGKTTLISMLVTTKKPTSGKALVNGFDIEHQMDDVRKSIGIVFQDPSLDEELTAFENLELHATMYGIGEPERSKRIAEVVKTVGLSDRLKDVVKTFSGGMRRRLEIARGLLHYPKVLFLDEPTIGLDPQTRSNIWGYIKKLKKEKGITILLTTHYMEEADSVCDRIAIIDHGQIIALDTPESLKNSLGGDVITVETPEAERLSELVKKLKWVKEAKAHDGKLTLCVEFGEKAIPKIVTLANSNKIQVDSTSLSKPTLDDVFLHYTGRTIREENISPKESMRIRRMAWRGRH